MNNVRCKVCDQEVGSDVGYRVYHVPVHRKLPVIHAVCTPCDKEHEDSFPKRKLSWRS